MDRAGRITISRLFACMVVVVLSGCNVGLEQRDVVGSWECRRGIRISCIDVRDDHTYTQVITVGGVQELSTTSTWGWELKPGDGMAIEFKGFHHIADDGSAIKRPPGYWLVVPERTVPFGKPKLSVSDDVSIEYTKLDAPCAGQS
jgi:hypothetical protein